MERHVTRSGPWRCLLRLSRGRPSRIVRISGGVASPRYHHYATFCGKNPHEIDLISLRRRVSSPDVNVSLRTSLDPAGSLSGLYDPTVVDRALFQFPSKCEESGRYRPPANPLEEFVETYHLQLWALSICVKNDPSNPYTKLSQLTPQELGKEIGELTELFQSGQLRVVGHGSLASWQKMAAAYSHLLLNLPDLACLPLALDSVLELVSPSPIFVNLYSSGIGNFLPELHRLSTEFLFENLSSVKPVVTKISSLVSEFSRFLKEHEDSHDYDEEFFRVVIYVLRYKKLQEILVAVGQKNITPKHLAALTKDPEAYAIQEAIRKLSGESKKLDDMVFVQFRNFFNLIYSATGLLLFDTLLSTLHLETENSIYSLEQRSKIDNFVDSFVPLLCGGLISIDALQREKYSCLPVKYNGKVLPQFKISDNIFDNYQFSLAMLFDIPGQFYLLKAASATLKKPFAECSFEELSKEILTVGEKNQLFKEDSIRLVDSLKQMQAYSMEGLKTLDLFNEHEKLLHAAQEYESQHVYVSKLHADVVDLTSALKGTVVTTDPLRTSIRINNLELEDFGTEIHEFKAKDLAKLPYSCMNDKTIIRFLNLRIADALDDISNPSSAVTPENVTAFAKLHELLTATFDINGGSTAFLDGIADDNIPSLLKEFIVEPSTEYFQIPEHLKIHDFTTELEILKTDELRSSFKNFSPERIISLLEKRIVEFNKGLPNTNLASRMNLNNLPRFMKLSARLKNLFDINNGNTEVLDAVLRSQSELQKLELKLAQKRQEAEAKAESEKAERIVSSEAANLYAPGPYVQIPEKLQLHEFVNELAIFRQDDLRSSYKNFSAEKVLNLMQKRIKEIYSDLPSTNLALRMSKANLVSFIKLHAKLEKLLAWNGGNTGILDTLIYSQSVFSDFETKLAEKKLQKSSQDESTKAYRQVTDDMVFEDFADELVALKRNLGKEFKSATPEEILTSLQELTDKEDSTSLKLIYGKLARNLIVLFKHNNDQTFVLDNVLLSANAFKKFESNLEKAVSADNKFVMSEFLSEDEVEEVPIEYHDEDYVLSLLNSQSAQPDSNEALLDSDLSIQDAVTMSLSKEENKLFEENPEEYAAINNMTAQKIREGYVKTKHKTKDAHLDKESLERFLKSTKRESEIQAEQKWREQRAYEWSTRMQHSHRSLESRSFFNTTLFGIKSSGFPMFPSIEHKEYMVLTAGGQKFISAENPLGSKEHSEDIFAILDKFDEADLEKFSKNIRKLQKKHWKLVGGVLNEKMLVLSRPHVERKSKYLTRIKTVLASTGLVFLTLIGLNIWLDDGHQETVQISPAPALDRLTDIDPPAEPETPSYASPTSDELRSTPSLWKRILWRD